MAVGFVETKHLTDIANAIRRQNGTATKYKPGDMATAVLTLDGVRADTPGVVPYIDVSSGVVSRRYLQAIADAIRTQNGLAETYKPEEMAQAILDLEFPIPRALLLSDGTLEFTYLHEPISPIGGTIDQVFIIDPTVNMDYTTRPWYNVRNQVTRAVFDVSFADAGITNAAYWFNGFSNMTSVSGFENLQGLEKTSQMFVNCPSLESIFATDYDNTTITTSTSMFYRTFRLVGGDGTVHGANGSSATILHLGNGGILTDPNDDPRLWYYGYLYLDGTLEITNNSTWDSQRTLALSGRLCSTANYQDFSAMPWTDGQSILTSVTINPDMATFQIMNMDCWFFNCEFITSISGLGNLNGVKGMRHAFRNCKRLTSIDLSGFVPSNLTNLYYTFAYCESLTTIYCDSNWELPIGMESLYDTFGFCSAALVGGNGTVWSTQQRNGSYLCIDTAITPGYMTVR